VRGIIGALELCVRTGPSDLGCAVLGRSLETNGCRHGSVALTVRLGDGRHRGPSPSPRPSAECRVPIAYTERGELMADGPWPRAHGPWPRAEGRGLRADGRWPMADGRGPMADGRWLMAEGRGLVADGRWPMADGRWQMADGRWPMAEGRGLVADGRVPSAEAEGAAPDRARPRERSRSTSGRRSQPSNERCSSDEPTPTSPDTLTECARNHRAVSRVLETSRSTSTPWTRARRPNRDV